jgi:small subunit ribosomal protein S8
MARKKVVEVPASNLKKDITRILYDKGYILSWKIEDDGKQGMIKIALKYNTQTAKSAIKELTRVSSPGLRQYAHAGICPACSTASAWPSSPPARVWSPTRRPAPERGR